MQDEAGRGYDADAAEILHRGLQIGEAPAGQPYLEVAVSGQPPCLRDPSPGAQLLPEAVHLGAGSQLHPHQSMQLARITRLRITLTLPALSRPVPAEPPAVGATSSPRALPALP